MRTVTHMGNVYQIEDPNLDKEQVKQAMVSLFPELERAEAIEDEHGNITFSISAGTKG